MIIAEHLVLLALDPEAGSLAPRVRREALERGARACLLCDLAISRRIGRRGRGIARLDDLPDYHPLLESAARSLPAREVSFVEALAGVGSALGSVLPRLIDSLLARDVLVQQRRGLLRRRYPVRSMRALHEVHHRLQELNVAPQPQAPSIALAMVADSCGVLEARTTAEELSGLRARIAELRRAPVAGGPDLSLLYDIAAASARR